MRIQKQRPGLNENDFEDVAPSGFSFEKADGQNWLRVSCSRSCELLFLRKRLRQRHGFEHGFALVHRFLKFRFRFGVYPRRGKAMRARVKSDFLSVFAGPHIGTTFRAVLGNPRGPRLSTGLGIWGRVSEERRAGRSQGELCQELGLMPSCHRKVTTLGPKPLENWQTPG